MSGHPSGNGNYTGCAYGYGDVAPFTGPRDCPVCNGSGFEGPIETTLPHSEFGDPECCGCLSGVIRGDQADIVCNECGTVLRTVPAANVGQTLTELEITLDVASAMCPHCGLVNLFPGFSKMLAFTCQQCGKAVLQPWDTAYRRPSGLLVQVAPRPRHWQCERYRRKNWRPDGITARENRMPKHRMRGMKQSVPKSVDEYIAAQSEVLRPKLEQVRATIRRAVPEAVEGIGYRMPAYKLYGKPMLYFAGFKEHYSLFAASGTFFAALEDELRGYELRKGTIQFPLTKPVPVKLIDRIAKLRAAGIAATAKKPVLGREKERRK